MTNNNFLRTIFIIVCIIYTTETATKTFFISNVRDYYCWPYSYLTDCDGSFNKPFDSFKYLLQYSSYFLEDNNTYNIIFLGKEGTIHYILPNESYYYWNYGYQPYFQSYMSDVSFVLKPAFCNDPSYTTYDTTKSKCVESTEPSIILYIKTIDLTIFSQSFTIQNLILDGIDLVINPAYDCKASRYLCCGTNGCNPSISMYVNTTKIYGLIATKAFTASNVIFQNMLALNNTSLISFTEEIVLNIDNCNFTKVYFPQGIISNSMLANDSYAKTSSITITNTQIFNYNNRNLFSYGCTTIEGFLINLPAKYIGSISITNSTFQNLTNSCGSYSCNYNPRLFQNPNNQEPFMTNDYIQSIKLNGGYASGVVAIAKLQGSLQIIDSNFTNIVGFSGTALSIIDMSATSSVTIKGNILTNNFVYSDTATIQIHQSPTGNNFVSSASCQEVTISSNIFKNNSGCPGSPANIMVTCAGNLQNGQQPLQPGTTDLSAYTTFFNSAVKKLQITNNTFQLNSLIFSNCLFVYGFTGVYIYNNTFSNNLIQTPNYTIISTLYTSVNDSLTYTWNNYYRYFTFYSTSPIFMSLCTNIEINYNEFNNNWGMNSSTSLRGSQITMDNIIVIGLNSVKLIGNIFENYQGMPAEVATANIKFKFTITTSIPLITLNFANVDNYLNSISSTSNEMIVDSNIFRNNVFNYIIPYSFNSILTNNTMDYVPFIRLYDENEKNIAKSSWTRIPSDSKVQLTIKNSTFTSNKIIITKSVTTYFFLNNFIQKLLIQDCQFINNKIIELNRTALKYPNAMALVKECTDNGKFCWLYPNPDNNTNIKTNYTSPLTPSLIAIWANNSLQSFINVTNCIFQSNLGIPFKAFLDSGISLTFNATNNTITNTLINEGKGSILMWNRTTGSIIMNNNNFSNNQNIQTIMDLTSGPTTYTENSNIYINNSLGIALKYLFYNESRDYVPNSNSPSTRQFTHTCTGSIYQNNTITSTLHDPLGSLLPVGAVIISIANNAKVVYSESNAIIKDIIATYMYLMSNKSTYTATNITYNCLTVEPITFILIGNGSMTLTNSKITSYPALDLVTLQPGGILSPFAIITLQSQVIISNTIINMCMNIISATNSSITIGNITARANFTINIRETLFKGFSFDPIFYLQNSSLTINGSNFYSNNGFMNTNLSNVTFNASVLSDYHEDAIMNWAKTANQIINSSFIVTNCRLAQLSSNFYFDSSNASFNQTIIWGYLDNPVLALNLTNSTLNFTSILFTNLLYNMNTGSLSTININGMMFNTAQFKLIGANAAFATNGIIAINSIFIVDSINSSLQVSNTISLQAISLNPSALPFVTPFNYMFSMYSSSLVLNQDIISQITLLLQNSTLNINNLNMMNSTLILTSNISNTTLMNGLFLYNECNLNILGSNLTFRDLNLTQININVNAENSQVVMTNTSVNSSDILCSIYYKLMNSSLAMNSTIYNHSNLNIQSFTLSNVSLNNVTITQVSEAGGVIMILNDNPLVVLNNSQFMNNAFFKFETMNSLLNFQNTTVNQRINSRNLALKLNYSTTFLQNCTFIDNYGLISILEGRATFSKLILLGKGPYMNSGGIALNLLQANVTMNDIFLKDNYAATIARSSNITMGNVTMIETYTSWYKNTDIFTADNRITSLYVFSECQVLMGDINFLTSNEIISTFSSHITISNFILRNHANKTLINDIVKFTTSYVSMINCTFKNYNITFAILGFDKTPQVNMTDVKFMNNTISSSNLVSISNPGNITLNNMVFYPNNTLNKSNEIQILLANGKEVNIFNSMFNSTIYTQSFSIYLKTHVSTTNLTNCSFADNKNVLFSSSLWILNIDNCSIFGNDSIPFTNYDTPNQIFAIEQNANTYIRNSIFKGLVTYLGVFNIKYLTQDNFVFENVIFLNNRAFRGAAINSNYYGNNSLTLLRNVTFYNNSANILTNLTVELPTNIGYGGAIYYFCNENLFCNFTITNTTFENNFADESAGGVYSNYFPPFFDVSTVVFKDNKAKHGADVASTPIQFVIVLANSSINLNPKLNWPSLYFKNSSNLRDLQQTQQQDQAIPSLKDLPNLVSGRILPQFLEIYTLDVYQQLAGADSSTVITLTFNESTYGPSTYTNVTPNIPPTSNVSRIKVENGMYKYNNVLLSFWPGSNASGHFAVSNLAKIPPYITSNIDSAILASMTAVLNLKFNYRHCIMGEVFLDTGVCYPCSEGFFSLVIPNNSKHPCEECNFDVSYCLGAAKVAPLEKYWRKNESANLFLRCPNEDACLGSSTNESLYTPSGICANGYSGHLCNTCPKGSINVDNGCVVCNNNLWYYLRLGLILLVQAVLVIMSVKATIESLQKVVDIESSNQVKIDSQIAVSIKILTNFVQIISIVKLFDFKWPSILSSLVTINEQIGGNSAQNLSIDCILLFWFPNAGDSLTYLKYLSIFLLPFAFTFVALLIWMLIYYSKNPRPYDKKAFMKRILTTIVVLNFNLQPNLILYSLLIFQCQNIYRTDMPEYYLTSNYQIQCYTMDYIFKAVPLGIINLALWGFIFPLGIFGYLKKNQDKLYTEEVKSKFSFIYDGYKNSKFYWEQIALIRKILLIGTYVFVKLISVPIQAWFVFIIIFFSLMLQLQNQPLITDRLNFLEEKAQFCCVFIAFAALYYMLGPGPGYIDTTMLVLCIVTNVWFLGSWGWFYAKLQYQSIKNNNVIAKLLKARSRNKVMAEDVGSEERPASANNEGKTPLNQKQDLSGFGKEILENEVILSRSHIDDSHNQLDKDISLDLQIPIEYPKILPKRYENHALARIKLKKSKTQKPKSIDLQMELDDIINMPIKSSTNWKFNHTDSERIDYLQGDASINLPGEFLSSKLELNEQITEFNKLSESTSRPDPENQLKKFDLELDLEKLEEIGKFASPPTLRNLNLGDNDQSYVSPIIQNFHKDLDME